MIALAAAVEKNEPGALYWDVTWNEADTAIVIFEWYSIYNHTEWRSYD